MLTSSYRELTKLQNPKRAKSVTFKICYQDAYCATAQESLLCMYIWGLGEGPKLFGFYK